MLTPPVITPEMLVWLGDAVAGAEDAAGRDLLALLVEHRERINAVLAARAAGLGRVGG